MRAWGFSLCLFLMPCVAYAGSISMTWTVPAPTPTQGVADRFTVYSGQGSVVCSDSTTVLSQSIASTTEMAYTHTGLLEGSLHCYEVTGVNVGGESPHSNRVSKVVPTNPPPAPLLR